MGLKQIPAALVRRHGHETQPLCRPRFQNSCAGWRYCWRGLHAIDFGFQVAVGGQHVQPAIEIVVEKEHAELQQAFWLAGPTPSLMASSAKTSESRGAT